MTALRTRLGALLLLAFAAAAPAFAVGQARMYGVVSDEAGNPIPGAKITVTQPAMGSFKIEVVTDKKGKFSLALVDATKVYDYKVEKEGFQGFQEQIKIDIQSNTEHNFRLLSMSAAQAQAAAQGGEVGSGGGGDPAVLAYNAGVEAIKAKDNKTAEAKFLEAMQADPELPQPLVALASLYVQDKRFKEAAEMAEKAVALDSGDTNAMRLRLEAYKGLGDKAKIAEAQAALNTADPGSAAIDLYNQGVTAYNAGKTDEALGLFEKALAADGTYARTHYMLGLCYVSANKTKEAKEHFQKFIEMAPSDPDVATAKEMMSYL